MGLEVKLKLRSSTSLRNLVAREPGPCCGGAWGVRVDATGVPEGRERRATLVHMNSAEVLVGS